MKKHVYIILTTMICLSFLYCKNSKLDFHTKVLDVDSTNIKTQKKTVEYDQEAIDLNNQAYDKFKYIITTLNNNTDSLIVKNAMQLLNKSIEKDSSYYLAYINKTKLLMMLNQFEEAIKTMQKIIRIKLEYAEGITFLGLIYEKMGMTDSAYQQYNTAIKVYSRRKPNSRLREFSNKTNIVFLFRLLNDKVQADSVLNKLYSEFPEYNSQIDSAKEIIDNFNRESFLDNY